MKKSRIDLCHLKRRADIVRLFRKSKVVKGRYVIIRCFDRLSSTETNNDSVDCMRYIVVPQRNFGLSVKRNLIRRRVNEICRLNYDKFKSNFDIGIFVQKESPDIPYDVLENDILRTLGSVGVLVDSKKCY